jgi:hypothetical protein
MLSDQLAFHDGASAVRPAKARRIRTLPRRLIEACAFGLACGGGLLWASGCVVAIFGQEQLVRPYWPALRGLRTDTATALAFLVGGVGLAVSEYLRLDRSRGTRSLWGSAQRSPAICPVAQAAAGTVAVMSIGLVVYLSANQVTHPATIDLQATHFAAWPTEGTLRVLALLTCAVSTAVLRWLRAEGARSVTREEG